MKNVFITGGNSGLGLMTAKALLDQGYGVVLGCRNMGRGEKAKKWLIHETKNLSVTVAVLDLASFESIRTCCSYLNDDIYGLICNAGVSYTSKTRYTKEGFEETFGVNHLGHFLLTHLLLKKFNNLKRIAIVSSALHDTKIKSTFPAPDYTDAMQLAFPVDNGLTDWVKTGQLRYATSKLCNVLFTYELDRRLKWVNRNDIMVNAFNPGFMPGTGLGRDNPFFVRMMWYYILPLFRYFVKFMRSTDESGKALAELITSVNCSERYFDGKKIVKSSDDSYDLNKAINLWDVSEKLTLLSDEEKIKLV